MTIEEEIARALAEWRSGEHAEPWEVEMYTEAAAALSPLLNRVRAEAVREFARQTSKRNIGTLSYRQQVLQHAESYADRIEQNSEGNET